MGCIISSAVLPATLALMWKDQNWQAAAGAPVLGFICAIIAWLVTAKKQCGVLNVDCTGSNNPMLAGNVTALLSPIVFVPILTFAFGKQNYDWQSMKNIRRVDDSDIIRRSSVDAEIVQTPTTQTPEEEAAEQKKLSKAAIIARTMTVVMTLALLVLWPMPLYGTGYIFSKKFFTGRSSRPSPSYGLTQANIEFSNRVGRRGNHVVVLQHILCRAVPALARPQDHGPYREVDHLGHYRQEEARSSWSCCRGRRRKWSADSRGESNNEVLVDEVTAPPMQASHPSLPSRSFKLVNWYGEGSRDQGIKAQRCRSFPGRAC